MEFIVENGILQKVIGSSDVIEFPQNVRGITDMAPGIFNTDNKPTRMVIHENITELSDTAFWGNRFNESFSVSENNPAYRAIDGDLYTADGKTLIAYALGKREATVSIPKGVERLAYSAFSYSDVLEEVIIPDGVTEIGDSTFICCEKLKRVVIPKSVVRIGRNPFWNCEKLERIEVDENNPAYKEIDGNLYARESESLLQYANGRNESVFTVPDGVKEIGYYAFCGSKTLTVIRLPDGVTKIGASAFCGCLSLERINIPDGVTVIGERAFEYCKKLADIELPESITVIGEGAFDDCSALERISIPHGVTTIEDAAFIDCEALKTVCIPDSVTSIGNMAFQNCKSITEILIPDSVVSMGYNAFCGCRSLVSVVVSRNVTNIVKWMFYHCEKLKQAVIPGNIASVGESPFWWCKSLEVLSVSAETLPILEEADGIVDQESGTDVPLICGVRGCLIRYASGQLSDSEEVILRKYVTRYFDKLCGEVGKYPQFIGFFTDKKLISAKQAVDMLSQVKDVEYRALLIDYSRKMGRKVDVDSLLGLE